MMTAPLSAEWDAHDVWATRARLAGAYIGIGAHRLIERASGHRAERAGDVPRSVAEFTCEWLTAILCREHPGAQVLSFVPGERSSGSTDRQAFSVRYNDAGVAAGLPTELFNKHTASVKIRVFMKMAGTLENEIGFYQSLRPQLEIETPRAYHIGVDRRSWRSAIILENVCASRQAVFCDTKDRIARAGIEAMLALLARVHGRFWDDPRLETEYKWLRTPLRWVVDAGPMIHYRERASAGLHAALDVVPDSLASQEKEVWRTFGASLVSSTQKPHTFLHGDPHIANYYRTGDGRMGIVDWQVTLRGSWEFDFAYTLLTSLTIDERRSWERDLLAFYLDRLGSAGGTPPPFDAAWLAYRRQTLYTYLGWLCTLGAQYQQPRATTLEVIKRSATAMIDLESLQCLRD